MTKFYLLIFYCTCIMLSSGQGAVYAQQPAFPGAEGFGRFTSGGRGGEVYLVTNLNDSGSGSLRAGLEMSGTRTIVFRVSGTIALESEIRIRNGNLTIAGQTAPGDGIALKGYGLVVDADNIIIRYLRIRPGDISGNELDAIWGREQKNIIIDHCSFSWATDEVASFYDNENFTMQWCIISESLYESVHTKGRHGYGGIWGGAGATFHHNLLAHHSSRNPRFNGARYTTTPETELVDHRNNVVFNWGGNSAYGGEGGNYNMVANYYKPGPAAGGEKRYRIVEPYGSAEIPLGRWFVKDNFVEGYPEVSADNRNGGVQNLSEDELALALAEEPFNYAPVSTETALEAYNSVTSGAGANFPRRDPVDSRIAEEARSGQVNFGGAYGAEKGIIDTQETVGGWPVLFSAPAPEDADQDGMPDEWELANALDPENPDDRNEDPDGDGYTSLEEYLNGLTGTEPESFLKHPSRVEVREVSTTGISLSWENNTESESQIIVERATGDAEFEVIATLPAGAATFQDEGLAPEGLYLYRLQATNENETSAYSMVVSAGTLPEPLAPDPAGLAGYWGFDAAEGTRAEDKSRYGNTAELQDPSGAEWVSGKVNRAVDFSEASASAHVLIPDGEQLSFGSSSFSVSLWLKAAETAAEATIFQKGNFDVMEGAASGGKGFGLFLKEGKIHFAVDDGTVRSVATADSKNFLTGDWVHITVVRNREMKVLRIYRNAGLIQEAKDYTGNSLSVPEPLVTGNSAGLTAPFKGAVDELRVYSYSLSYPEAGGVYGSLHQAVVQPSPRGGATGLNPEEVFLSWTGDAPSYNIYLGTTADNLTLLAEGLTTPFYNVSGLSANTTYFWRADATGSNGTVTAGETWSFTAGGITGLNDRKREEYKFSCSPNPFSSKLKVRFQVSKMEEVELWLYNMQNQLVGLLYKGGLNPGAYHFDLDLQEAFGFIPEEGMYFCLLRTPETRLVKKLVRLNKL